MSREKCFHIGANKPQIQGKVEDPYATKRLTNPLAPAPRIFPCPRRSRLSPQSPHPGRPRCDRTVTGMCFGHCCRAFMVAVVRQNSIRLKLIDYLTLYLHTPTNEYPPTCILQMQQNVRSVAFSPFSPSEFLGSIHGLLRARALHYLDTRQANAPPLPNGVYQKVSTLPWVSH